MSVQDAQELERVIADLHQQLVQAQKLGTIGALSSSITHEFNNILTTIINYAKLGLRHNDADTREKSLNKILAAGQRASRITTGMLSYAKHKVDQREASDLVQLVEDVLVLVEKDLQIHRVKLQTRFDGRPQSVVNSGQIQQVLLNLIINARQAMENGGRLMIDVRTNSEAGMVEIAVRDTGAGIPADKLRQIFEPFYSTKAGPDAQGQGGTGLGLSLVREIIESHQGRIRVESAVGAGTTFTLKLPLHKPAA
ncbi:MAG TPA: ATP-binding protein [Planctomycetaceae bacterium]|jgi:signal transduction histidine kinase|nr:ATP-binding protein [Planctomycetaceae bacterium]